jgi:hypothetical protein
MAPRTLDGLAHEMVFGGRIRHGNPEFTNIDGPAPTFAFCLGQILHPGALDSVVYSEHTLRMAPDGRIPECTHVGGQCPLSPLAMARFSALET